MDKSEEILKLEREQLKFQKDNISLFQDLVEGQHILKELSKDILHHQSKQALIIIGIVFLSGVLIGTQYKSWLPYVDNVMTAVKSTKQVSGAIK